MANENTTYVLYLIERAQSGVRNAFFDLCEINIHNVFNIVYRLMANYEKAKSITLEVFFHSLENIKEFDVNTSFLLWIKDLAIKHSIFDLQRDGLNNSYKTIEKPSSDPHQLLDQLILSLPDEERIVVVLHDVEDYTYDEIKNYLPELSFDEIKSKLINAREFMISKT